MATDAQRANMALFVPIPVNDLARKVATDKDNEHLVTLVEGRIQALQIGGFHSLSGSSDVLATMGRYGDISLGKASPRHQCEFTVNPRTKAVHLFERSNPKTTVVEGGNGPNKEFARLGNVALDLNTEVTIRFGRKKENVMAFVLRWRANFDELESRIERRSTERLSDHPRVMPTIEIQHSPSENHHVTRLATDADTQIERDYIQEELIGEGSTARVFKARWVLPPKDVFAVKVMERPKEGTSAWKRLKAEIETHAKMAHENIIRFIGTPNFEGVIPQVTINMQYAEYGSLVTFFNNNAEMGLVPIANRVLEQMLRAIAYVHRRGYFHRDVKPANILVGPGNTPDQYKFYLCDFGHSSRVNVHGTTEGTKVFMAPEAHNGDLQTHKVDLWGLFVTILWVLDIRGFRKAAEKEYNYHHTMTRISEAKELPALSDIRSMAMDNPDQRLEVRDFIGHTKSDQERTLHLQQTSLYDIPDMEVD